MIYDCLFPYTVGGAERTYRRLAELLAADGHQVTYLTLRQWNRAEQAEVAGVRVVAAGPRMHLYSSPGRRRVLPPVVFGLGVLWHLLRHRRRYDAVHCASFPYFALLAAAAVRGRGGYRLVVDWHEVWTQRYWREYLGPVAGRIGWLVQRLCVRLPQRAFCYSRLHAQRLRDEGFRGEVTVLPGEWIGPMQAAAAQDAEPIVVFAGRHIPEKRVLTIPPAIVRARSTLPELRCVILGDGPDRAELLRQVDQLRLNGVIEVPGFVTTARVDQEIGRALCMLLPSRREGYGLVVFEASAHGTPSVVVKGPDNAAVELIDEGENGFIVDSASPENLADAILRVHRGGTELRRSTASWFERNAERHSLRRTLEVELEAYGHSLR